MTYFNGQIALANNNRTAIIEFHGYEGEDFRHFQEVLESYLGLNNVTNEARKLAILKAQLRGPAKIYSEPQNWQHVCQFSISHAVSSDTWPT